MRSNNSLRRNGKYRRSMRQILGFNFYDVFVFLFCIVFALVCVYPMWYVLVASVTPYEEYIKGGLMLWPTGGVDLQYYKAIFSTKSFTNSMWISVSKTVIATVLSVLVTASMAYGVSKVHVKGMKVINALVVFNLFFTGGLIPQYILYQNLGLLRNYWVMVIPGALNITYFIIMRNYYSYSVPKSLEEAALLDGCTDIGVFFRIVIPVSRSMLAAIALFIAVINWNDYYNYMMFISNKTNLQPFAWILRRMLVDQTMMNQVRNGLPASFVGNGRDESPVASAMKKYRAEAMRFAGQVMLATGYFNTRLPTEQPKTEINYTELRLSYSNGIVFYFVADRSRDGVCGCYLQRITLDGKQIYNGCFSRYSSVDDVLQKTQSNGECQNAHYHFIE